MKKQQQQIFYNYNDVYYSQQYTFTFSEQHKLFNDNTQNILTEISVDRGEYCYLTYLEKTNKQKKKYNYK
tara:strand:- start:172 stop:381 length:210 start_codon:yes stop_codon:yes gene_type:complete